MNGACGWMQGALSLNDATPSEHSEISSRWYPWINLSCEASAQVTTRLFQG